MQFDTSRKLCGLSTVIHHASVQQTADNTARDCKGSNRYGKHDAQPDFLPEDERLR